MDIKDIINNIDYKEYIIKYCFDNENYDEIKNFIINLDIDTIKKLLLYEYNYNYGCNLLFETLFCCEDINIPILLLEYAYKCKIDLKNIKDNYNTCLLMLAVERENIKTIKFLIEKGCDIYHLNNHNESIIDLAINNNIDIIQIYLDIKITKLKKLSFCKGFHNRLGSNSKLNILPYDLIQNII